MQDERSESEPWRRHWPNCVACTDFLTAATLSILGIHLSAPIDNHCTASRSTGNQRRGSTTDHNYSAPSTVYPLSVVSMHCLYTVYTPSVHSSCTVYSLPIRVSRFLRAQARGSTNDTDFARKSTGPVGKHSRTNCWHACAVEDSPR